MPNRTTFPSVVRGRVHQRRRRTAGELLLGELEGQTRVVGVVPPGALETESVPSGAVGNEDMSASCQTGIAG
jgi:hypothetical protein